MAQIMAQLFEKPFYPILFEKNKSPIGFEVERVVLATSNAREMLQFYI